MKRMKKIAAFLSAAAVVCGGMTAVISGAVASPVSEPVQAQAEGETINPYVDIRYDTDYYRYTYQSTVGNTFTLEVDYGASVGRLYWRSSDTSIATVDDWGEVTVLAAGEVTITCDTGLGTSDSIVLDCYERVPFAYHISAPEYVYAGDTFTVTGGYSGTCWESVGYGWRVDNNAITLEENYNEAQITVPEDFTGQFTLTLGYGSSEASAVIHVYAEPAVLVMEDTMLNLDPGDSYALKCWIWNPADSPCDLTFSCKSDILSVDETGNITVPAGSPGGTAKIRVSLNNNTEDTLVYVNVTPPPTELPTTEPPTDPPTDPPLQVQPEEIVLKLGEIQKLTANRTVASYAIVDESIAHMVKDFVAADAVGSTYLIAEDSKGATCSVRITVLPDDPVQGDVTLDGEFSIADLIQMQKFLLGRGQLTYWKAADMDENGNLNVLDIILMKRKLLR